MKEVCTFWLDRLKALPDGTLVAPNGYSPEHGPHEDGVSFEQELIWNLFTDTIEASEALGTDKDFRNLLETKLRQTARSQDRQVGAVAGMDDRPR